MLIAFLPLAFTGCNREVAENVKESWRPEEPDAKQNGEMDNMLKKTVEENRFFNSTLAVMIDDVLYFTEETPAGKVQLTYFYDTKTGLVMPLCGRPECSHKTEDCAAFYASTFGDLNYAFYNGELYWIGDMKYNKNTGERLLNVYACGPDGMNRRVAVKLDWEYDALASGFFGIYDGRIYRGGVGRYVVNGNAESGSLIYSRAINGDPDVKEIFRMDEEANTLLCALAPGVLYFAVFGNGKSPAMTLYKYDIASDELKTLYDGEVPCWAFRMSALEDRILFYESRGAVFSYLLQTGDLSCVGFDESVGLLEAGDRSFLASKGYSGYCCFDLDGKLLYEGERDPSLFHEEKQTKQYLGCYKGAFYFIYSSEKYHYLVVYDSNTDTWTVPWEAKVAK